MSNLTYVEKRKLGQFLGMSSGYVLDFSNRTFAEFVRESTGRNIYDSTYDYASADPKQIGCGPFGRRKKI
jgi:hypothetical protein